MTYIIADKTISFGGNSVTPEEAYLIRKFPNVFKSCLNSATQEYLLIIKKVVHLFTDIFTFYCTLLSKIQGYDDIKAMANIARTKLSALEDDLDKIFGPYLPSESGVPGEGWENEKYEYLVKPLTLAILKSVAETLSFTNKTLNCIHTFFLSFENLKKLLIPALVVQSPLILKLISSAMFLFSLTTIVNEITQLDVLTPTIIKQLSKIDTVNSGIERETRILHTVFNTMNLSVFRYTNVLIGTAILKEQVSEDECRLVRRREISYRVSEHVVSIPLTSDNLATSQYFTKNLFIVISAAVLLLAAIIYRLYTVLLG